VRFVVCHTCKNVVQIGGDPLEVSDLLGISESFACVTPLCRGRMTPVIPSQIPMNYVRSEIPIRGFYRAIYGFGSGVGDPASLKRLRELLLTQRVVDLRAEPVGQPERVILRELVLENGTRLHFETSARGACVYYIEEPGPTCVEVVENELSADAVTESGNSYREEARRATEAQLEGGVREGNRSVICSPTGAPELPDTGSLSLVSEAGLLPSSVISGRTQPSVDSDLRMRTPNHTVTR
jgi:hypothetical protein